MSNKETIEEKSQELLHLTAIVFHTTLKEVNDAVGAKVYEICKKMQDEKVDKK